MSPKSELTKSSTKKAPKKGAPKGVKNQRKNRILDSAEEMFSLRGFHGVTLRQIAAAANVDVALANYHFGRKRALFDAVLLRRVDIVNTARYDALEAYLGSLDGERPEAHGIVRAYLEPLGKIQASSDQGMKNYLALIAAVNNSVEWGGELMSQYFNPLIEQFIAALKFAFPQANDKAIYWGYHYLSGALTLTLAETGRIDQLSNGVVKASDTKDAYAYMIPFIAEGMTKICGSERNDLL